MSKQIRFETPGEHNTACNVEVLHPLVSLLDFSKITPQQYIEADIFSFGFYYVAFKESKCGDLKYGCNYYDYQEGTLIFIAPNQIIQSENRNLTESTEPKGKALLFHPDLLRGTTLGRNMKKYSFFSYNVNEALHISEQERIIIMDCLRNIDYELQHGMDNHSKSLIVSNIEMFLNYCQRFYERQFITRSHVNNDTLSRFEQVLDDYFNSGLSKKHGLPTVKYCADKLHYSASYLSDMLRKETGKSAMEHIQLNFTEVAKEKLFDRSKSISEIAYELGFEYPQYFSRLFKKQVGMTPNEFRATN
nr:helix-turn-helix transcriptional regulator [uncultured Bacteroides sp.]